MLNLQETKVLTALIEKYGITHHFDYKISGYPSGLLEDVVEEIEQKTGIVIGKREVLHADSDGCIYPELAFILDYSEQAEAQRIISDQVDTFIKEGIQLDTLS